MMLEDGRMLQLINWATYRRNVVTKDRRWR